MGGWWSGGVDGLSGDLHWWAVGWVGGYMSVWVDGDVVSAVAMPHGAVENTFPAQFVASVLPFSDLLDKSRGGSPFPPPVLLNTCLHFCHAESLFSVRSICSSVFIEILPSTHDFALLCFDICVAYQMLKVGKELYAMYKTGKMDVGKLGNIAKIAMS